MDGQQNGEQDIAENTPCDVERCIEGTFDNLSVQSKVQIGLFAALNSASSVTRRSKLPDRLWHKVRLDGGGPLVNQSEEANWLKGVADGILLMVDHM